MSKQINDVIEEVLSNKIKNSVFKVSRDNITTKLRWDILRSVQDPSDFYREIHDFIWDINNE